MPDREKVINGLREMSCRATWKDIDRIRDKFQPIINDAINLLKEQEAVKPILSYGTFRCGKCENIVGYNDGHGCGYKNNFCGDCGRKVKWND